MFLPIQSVLTWRLYTFVYNTQVMYALFMGKKEILTYLFQVEDLAKSKSKAPDWNNSPLTLK